MSDETKQEEVKEEARPNDAVGQAPAAAEEPKAEEKKEEKKEVETPAKFKDLVEKIEAMSVIELNELVKHLEEKFGVSAAAMMVAGGGGAAGGAEEEKDSFNVELTSAGEQKVQVIKAIKEALGLGLKDAKDLTDAAPAMLKEGMKKAEAEALKAAIEAAGGSVTLK